MTQSANSKSSETSNYKDTLLLPSTEFPMKAKLAEKEPEQIAWWEREEIFQKVLAKNKEAGAKPYIHHDGPPYANGNIHLGHVLNKVLKDIIVKVKNMQGFYTDYLPGWDCHGLPIELGVVKKLGKKRRDLSTAQFRDACREYAEEFIAIQREEFKRLGNFGRWQDPYKTMSFFLPGCHSR